MCQALLACAAVSLVAGCSDSAGVVPATTKVVSAVPTSVQVTLSGDGSPVVASTTLGCYGDRADLPGDLTVLFDAVALPASDRYPTALQTSAQGNVDRPGCLFAKTGLWFKPGRAFELVVPEELRDRLSIGWGQRSWSVVVPACTDVPAEWVAGPVGIGSLIPCALC